MMQIKRTTRGDIQSEEQLSAAYAGDAAAIAALIERSLLPSRTAVEAHIEGACLYLVLYGQPGQQDSLVRFIKSGLQQIQIPGVSELDIKVYAVYSSNPTEAGEPLWSYRGRLRQAPPTPITAKAIPPADSPRRVMTGSYSTQWTSHGLRIDATTPSPQRWVPRSAAPPAAQELFDRQGVLHEATQAVQAGTMLQVYGPSGSGKTTVLRHLAQQPAVQQRFGDGIIYVEGYNTPSLDLLQHLFEALYGSDNSLTVKPTLPEIRQALRRRNGLAIIDQVEVADSPEPLLDSLPLVLAGPECLLLDHGEVISLGAFSDHEALTFIEMRLGRALAPEEQRTAMDLCRHLAGNPALLIQHGEIVRRGQSSFAELNQQIDAGFSPDALVMRAASNLTDEERRVMATLAVFGPVGLQTHHLQAIAGVEQISDDLQQRGLVWATGDRLRLASNLLAPLEQVWDLAPWYDRALQYFSSWATAQHGRMPASGEMAEPDTLAALDDLWRLAERSAQQQRWTDTLQLCHALDPLLYQYCRWGRWQQAWALGRQAAQANSDRAAEAWASRWAAKSTPWRR
ncbi:MAG: AAA family ATPase [Cyanobacteria bacterium P01_A01_bin.135]